MDPSNSISTAVSFSDGLRQKLKKAIALKDYAISKNFDVPDQTIEWLNAAAESLESESQSSKLSSVSDNIDKAIRDLTGLTYPATIDTVSQVGASYKENSAVRIFFLNLLVLGACALIAGIASYAMLVSADASPALHSCSRLYLRRLSAFWDVLPTSFSTLSESFPRKHLSWRIQSRITRACFSVRSWAGSSTSHSPAMRLLPQ